MLFDSLGKLENRVYLRGYVVMLLWTFFGKFHK